MNPKIIILLLLMLLSLSSGLSFGQQSTPTVDVELSRSKVYVGDELTYQIIIRGIDRPADPVIDFPTGVDVVYRGRSSQSFSTTRIINGRNRLVTDRLYSFQYTLTATDVGIISIPSPMLLFEGTQYFGDPISFESIYPIKSDDDIFEVHLNRTHLYVNETVQVECQWIIAAKTTEFSFASSQIPETFNIMGLELQAKGTQQVRFSLGDQQVVGVVVEDKQSGVPVQKLIFRYTITPTESGLFELGPMRVVFTRHSGTGRSYRAYTQSTPITVTVSEVPMQNQPSDYSGVIGEFDLKIHAANTSVNIGDPIGLTLIIQGQEPMGGLDRSLSAVSMSGYSESFKVSSESWREVLPRKRGTRVYETTVRALTDSVERIPPVMLPSFNPLSESFEVYESNSIPIEVQAIEELTLSDAMIVGGLQGPVDSSDIEYTSLSPLAPKLWAHSSAQDMTRRVGFSLSQTLSNPVWITTIFAGPSLFAFVGTLGFLHKRRDPIRTRQRELMRLSRSYERQGKHAQSIRLYLSAVLDIDPESVVAQDAQLLSVDEHLKTRIVAVLDSDEQQSFVNHEDSSLSVPIQADGLLNEIRTAMKKGGMRS